MKFEIGDVISGLEYAGDTGIVRKITYTGVEVIYELATTRSDGFKSVLRIGYDKQHNLMVEVTELFGGSSWTPVKWELKKGGKQPVNYPSWYTLFKGIEPERD